jgi:nucleoside-diphosphate-sugar epimerase
VTNTRSGLSGRTVLVTGAAGFVGANLVSALEAEHAEVVCLVRAGTDPRRLTSVQSVGRRISADLLDYRAIQDVVGPIEPDYVFHMATPRSPTPDREILETNTAALFNLVRAVSSPRLLQFVHCGSSMEYGDIAAPYREDALVQPATLFGAGKAASTLLLQQMSRSAGLPLVILRVFQVYGPMDWAKRLIPTAIRAIRANRTLDLTAPGHCRDYVHVDDVVTACLAAADHRAQGPRLFNIASGRQTTNEEIVDRLATIIGNPAQVQVGDFPSRPWDRAQWCGDITLAREVLGWVPSVDLTDGLTRTVRWIEAHDI